MTLSLKNLRFRTRILILLGLFAAGLLGLYLMNQAMVSRVKIEGPLYNRIVEGKDLIADVLPPPEYIIESYLTVLRIVQDPQSERRSELVARLRQLQAEYDKRHAFWDEAGRLEQGPIRKELVDNSYLPARQFFDVVNQKFIPALESGQSEAELSKLVAGQLEPRYEEHRKAVDRVVELTKVRIETDEAQARATFAWWSGAQLAFGISVMAVVAGLAWLIGRGIVVPTTLMIDRVQDMADGAADLTKRVPVDSTDEMGRLGGFVNQLIQRIHDLIVRVRVSTIQLHSTSTEIAAAAAEQNTTMQNFSASSTQIAAAVKEITASGQELARTMDEVQARANEVSGVAGAGRASLMGMEDNMRRLADATGSISSKLGTIREKAGGINMVVTTITKVADQTNLLSINAAIEAEKAGEAGRGFLVVAREIRRLADQTAVATLDIEQMVKHMQSAVSAGVMEMDKFHEEVRTCSSLVSDISGQMAQVIEQVQGLFERFQTLNDAMRQQSGGVRQIDDAMQQLLNGCKQVTSTVRDFTSAATNLREAAQGLQQEVGRFTVSG